MQTSDFDYNLPPELIAQEPMCPRDSSRLLVVDRANATFYHRVFRDIPEFIHPADRLILNDTKVLPARLFCRKSTGAAVELLFVNKIDELTWRVMANPGRRLKSGAHLYVKANKNISFIIKEIYDNGDRMVALEPTDEAASILDVIERYGHIPLPPYIKRDDSQTDRSTYQTVYAQSPGAIAAPTAGLHFTQSLLQTLRQQDVEISRVTLHVGPGTFAPVKAIDPSLHQMHSEAFELTDDVARQIEATAQKGGRNIAVGTTVVRVLEHCGKQGLPLQSGCGETNLLILPGYRFSVVNALITNFHLPCSTLLMLVSAFAGRELILAAYEEAIQKRYRFYSYGDAMLIL